ncbi:hypothetical protein FRC07_009867 [Ceratobasidium sp. 392]|nr:hypothetical protein FRC07_009867 [Ceratobasidium sp. 392]
MIEVVGLIHPGNQEQIPFAWALYSNNDSSVAQFKKTFCRKEVNLHFVGVWDTVASVGIFPKKPFLLTDKYEHITHFRHALALDERRVKFLPEHVTVDYDAIEDQMSRLEAPGYTPIKGNDSLKEVWFAGTHSDIGGGNKVNQTLDRGGEPLKWMMEEAQKEGLSVRLHDVKIGTPHAEVTGSLVGTWWILEYLPISWRAYRPDGTSTFTRGNGRQVLPGQKIHWTVGESLNEGIREKASELRYIPRAWLVDYTGKATGWNKATLAANMDGVPWDDNLNLMARMVDLLKHEPTPESQNPDWLLSLHRYAEDGEPEAIWAYAGPQFLHRIMKLYPGDQKVARIVSLVIGFRDDLKARLNQIVALHKFGLVGRQDPGAEAQLNNIVIPRICLTLKQWAAKYKDANTGNAPTQSFWVRFLSVFKTQLETTTEPHSVDGHWNLERVPESTRSIHLVHTLLSLIKELMTLGTIKEKSDVVGNFASLTIALLPSEASLKNFTEREADISEKVLITMATLFEHESSKAVFFDQGTAKTLGLLFDARKSDSKLARLISRVVAVVGQDACCAVDISNLTRCKIIPTLFELMASDQQIVANEAAAATKIFFQEPFRGQLFALLKDIEHMGGPPAALYAVANIVKIDRLASSTIRTIIIQKALKALTCDDELQVQGAIYILRELLRRDISYNDMCQPSTSSALLAPLESGLISRGLGAGIVDLAVLLALKGPGSIHDDLFAHLNQLAHNGDIQAALAVLAAAAYNEHYRKDTKALVSNIIATIDSKAYRLAKQSIQVLTALKQNGYKHEHVSSVSTIYTVANLIRSASSKSWYESAATYDEQDELMLAAFAMIEALSVDPTARKSLRGLKVFEDMLAANDSWSDHNVHGRAVETLGRLVTYSDFVEEIEPLLEAEKLLASSSPFEEQGTEIDESHGKNNVLKGNGEGNGGGEGEGGGEEDDEETNELTTLIGSRSN